MLEQYNKTQSGNNLSIFLMFYLCGSELNKNCQLLQVALNTLYHLYHFAQLFRNMQIRGEHKTPSTSVRHRIRQIVKIFENFTNKKREALCLFEDSRHIVPLCPKD